MTQVTLKDQIDLYYFFVDVDDQTRAAKMREAIETFADGLVVVQSCVQK